MHEVVLNTIGIVLNAYTQYNGIVLNEYTQHNGIVLNAYTQYNGIVLNVYTQYNGIVLNEYTQHNGIVLNVYTQYNGIVLNAFKGLPDTVCLLCFTVQYGERLTWTSWRILSERPPTHHSGYKPGSVAQGYAACAYPADRADPIAGPDQPCYVPCTCKQTTQNHQVYHKLHTHTHIYIIYIHVSENLNNFKF